MRYTHTIWLVVWNMFYCSIILRIILPTDELIFFRGVGLNHQPAIIYTYIYIFISPQRNVNQMTIPAGMSSTLMGMSPQLFYSTFSQHVPPQKCVQHTITLW